MGSGTMPPEKLEKIDVEIARLGLLLTCTQGIDILLRNVLRAQNVLNENIKSLLISSLENI